MTEEILLTIGITSYNRPNEIIRCLKSINTKYSNKLEVVVSEDKSPRCEEIRYVVNEFMLESKYLLNFYSNEKNLGYDRNIMAIIRRAKGKYVLLMSDDDVFLDYSIDIIIEALEGHDYGVLYSAFSLPDNEGRRRYYDRSFEIEPSEEYAKNHVYDSILFSGLVFRKDIVENIDAEPFLNKIYFQVYLFLYCICEYGGYYLNCIAVEACGDGENGFGLNESSGNDKGISDRKSVLSFIEYHRRLIYCIRKFDIDYGKKITESFAKEYNIRSIVLMSIARAQGRDVLRAFYNEMKTLDIRIYPVSFMYYIMLQLFGVTLTMRILELPKSLLLKRRKETQ